jgi:hypothetical protein
MANGWSVRQAEQFSVVTKAQDKLKKAAKTEDVFKLREDAVSNLKLKLNTGVELRPRSKGGRIVIEYADDEELERIAGRL